jgi:hypothetical protein
VGAFRASQEEAYRVIVAEAERLRRKARMGAGALLERLDKLEREFRAERRRDYFRSPLRTEAAAAFKAARQAVPAQGPAQDRGVEVRDAEEGR